MRQVGHLQESTACCCLNRTPSQPTISTGTEPELRIAVVSWLRVVAGSYHVTTWNLLYPGFLTLL